MAGFIPGSLTPVGDGAITDVSVVLAVTKSDGGGVTPAVPEYEVNAVFCPKYPPERVGPWAGAVYTVGVTGLGFPFALPIDRPLKIAVSELSPDVIGFVVRLLVCGFPAFVRAAVLED